MHNIIINILFIVLLIFIFFYAAKYFSAHPTMECYDNIFGNNDEFNLSCTNNSIQRYVNGSPITTIKLPCTEKNLLTAENYFRTKYLNLPLNNYDKEIKAFNT